MRRAWTEDSICILKHLDQGAWTKEECSYMKGPRTKEEQIINKTLGYGCLGERGKK